MAMHIRNGRIIDPASGLDQVSDLYIVDDRVAAIGEAPAGFEAQDSVDASGKIVCPGLVDTCARLREPGEEHKGTIASETYAAVAGGITTLCLPPDSNPVIDSPAVVELIRQRAEVSAYCQVHILGGLSKGLQGLEITEMQALKQAGCVGISNGMLPVASPLVLRRALEYAASFDLTVFLNAEDSDLAGGGCAHEGPISLRLGLPGIPECAETIAVSRDLLLVEQSGARAHFCHVSSVRGLDMISRARQDGLPVTVDVAAHYLHLTDMDLAHYNSNCHIRPPLRSQGDRDGLIENLKNGVINAVCSDHQPHDKAAKLLPFPETDPGISALETLLPLTLRAGKEAGLSLSQTLALLTTGPASVLGIDAGSIAPGAVADICIFDAEQFWQVSETSLQSQGKNSPFIGWELQGRVLQTIRQGKLVYSYPTE